MSSNRFPKKDFKLSTERKKKFGKTTKATERFCFVISITGLNRPNSRKDNDDKVKSRGQFIFSDRCGRQGGKYLTCAGPMIKATVDQQAGNNLQENSVDSFSRSNISDKIIVLLMYSCKPVVPLHFKM
jgi:hypothetical protein